MLGESLMVGAGVGDEATTWAADRPCFHGRREGGANNGLDDLVMEKDKKEQTRCETVQLAHEGCRSSHLMCRCLHCLHPSRDLLCLRLCMPMPLPLPLPLLTDTSSGIAEPGREHVGVGSQKDPCHKILSGQSK